MADYTGPRNGPAYQLWLEERVRELECDVARYESGRVVMLAETSSLREKLHQAQQLTVRQANELRKRA